MLDIADQLERFMDRHFPPEVEARLGTIWNANQHLDVVESLPKSVEERPVAVRNVDAEVAHLFSLPLDQQLDLLDQDSSRTSPITSPGPVSSTEQQSPRQPAITNLQNEEISELGSVADLQAKVAAAHANPDIQAKIAAAPYN